MGRKTVQYIVVEDGEELVSDGHETAADAYEALVRRKEETPFSEFTVVRATFEVVEPE